MSAGGKGHRGLGGKPAWLGRQVSSQKPIDSSGPAARRCRSAGTTGRCTRQRSRPARWRQTRLASCSAPRRPEPGRPTRTNRGADSSGSSERHETTDVGQKYGWARSQQAPGSLAHAPPSTARRSRQACRTSGPPRSDRSRHSQSRPSARRRTATARSHPPLTTRACRLSDPIARRCRAGPRRRPRRHPPSCAGRSDRSPPPATTAHATLLSPSPPTRR
jgi:hypothetical protein